LAINPNAVEPHTNLGLALADSGRLGEAFSHLQKALELQPQNPQIHNSMGLVLASSGRADEGIAHFRRALELQPGLTQAHYNLGAAYYYLKGSIPETLSHGGEVLKAEPNQITVLNGLALILATSPDASYRNGPRAVELAERAVRLTGGQEPELLDTLA